MIAKPLTQSLSAALLFAGLAAASTPAAHAFSVTFAQGAFQSGKGGEFVAITSPSFNAYYADAALQTVKGLTGFSTFCLEKTEKAILNVACTGVLNDRAMNGGTDVTENPNLPGDPISAGTAWLYSLFARGELDSYDYGTAPYNAAEKSSRKADASVLQNAIWMLEDEESLDLGNYYIDLAIAKFGGIDAAKEDNDGRFNVRVINVTQGTTHRQDVLVCVPDGGSTVGMVAAALLGLTVIRRRSAA